MKVKNIIFDLGGVILNLDKQLTINAFEKLNAININNMFKNNYQLITDFSLGKIPVPLFRRLIQKALNISVTNDQFDTAWNAMLLDIPTSRLALIEEIRSYGYKTFLLSNTNYLHQKAVINILRQQHGLESFKDYFDNEYYSHEIGFCKPNKKAYQVVLENNWLSTNNTLFIDDSIECIEGAKFVGLQAIHLSKDLSAIDWDTYLELSYQKKVFYPHLSNGISAHVT